MISCNISFLLVSMSCFLCLKSLVVRKQYCTVYIPLKQMLCLVLMYLTRSMELVSSLLKSTRFLNHFLEHYSKLRTILPKKNIIFCDLLFLRTLGGDPRAPAECFQRPPPSLQHLPQGVENFVGAQEYD